MSEIYNREFFKWHHDYLHEEQVKHGQIIAQHYSPNYIVDFGCGIGSYLEGAQKDGCEIDGYDLYLDQAKEFATPEVLPYLHKKDITEPIETIGRGLVLSIETAEHLDPMKLDGYFLNLYRTCQDMLVFTGASRENRGGAGHLLEMPRDVWKAWLEEYGFEYSEELTEEIKDLWEDAQPYVLRNLIVCTP